MNLSNISDRNLYNLERFWDWMNTTNRAEIIYFEIGSKQLLGLFDKDCIDYYNTSVMAGLSDIIEHYRGVSEETRKFFIEKSTQNDWYQHVSEDNYICYQLFKVAWLMQDIRRNGQQSPAQLHKTIESYHCHPGSDKKYAMLLLDPIDTVKVFYVWYPEIDPNPWHLHYPHRKLETIEEFVEIFPMAGDPTFVFEYGNVDFTTEGFKCDTDHFDAFARFASDLLLKQAKREQRKFDPFSVKHLSYRDSIHRLKMERETKLLEDIYFESDDIFWMIDKRFTRKVIDNRAIWLPDEYNNFPKSLIDTNWTYNASTSMTFSIEYKDM